MKKILSIAKYVLLAISVVVVVLVFASSTDGAVDSSVSTMLVWAYALLGIAIIATILFPLFNLAQNPKGALRTLVGLAVVAVILGVSYALSSTAPVVDSAGGYFTNPGELKITDTGLYTTYIALAVAIVAVVAGEIRQSIKG